MQQDAILIVEDDPGIAELEQIQLERAGFRTVLAATAAQALTVLRCERVVLVLLDNQLPGGQDGLELFSEMRTLGFAQPVILVTGYSDEATAIRALRAGVSDFVTKTTEFLDYLPEAVERVLKQVRIEEQNRKLTYMLGERVKELTCLNQTTKILQNSQLSTADWLQQLALIVPPGWQYPHATAARFRLGELVFSSPGFMETPWLQRAEFTDAAGRKGIIEVAYLEEKPPEIEGPFLTEERGLINSLAEMLRSAINRRLTEEAMRISEARYRHVVEYQSEFIVRWLPDGTRTFVNDAYARFFRLDPNKCVGTSFLSLVPESVQKTLLQKVAAATPSDPVAWDERETRFPDGSIGWTEWSDRGIFNKDGKLIELQSVGRDITQRKRAELALSKNEEKLRREKKFIDTLMDSLPGIVLLFDAKLKLQQWNKIVEYTGGYSSEELAKLTLLDLIVAEDSELVAEAIQIVVDTGGHSVEARLLTKCRQTIPFYWKGVRLAIDNGLSILCIGIDISDRMRLEAQLRQAQKMEAIGQLAGGIAHDFNNLLTIINGYSELLAQDDSMPDPIRDMLLEIGRAGERAATLTSQLLAFSRRTVIEPKILDANVAIGNLEKMLRRLIGEDIKLNARLDRRLAHIKADPHLLEQAITNLAVNARDAMPRGGELTIETCNTFVEPEKLVEAGDVTSGQYVEISVSDTGTGMTEEVRARVFEPFFTTKDPDRGTGLGLAMVFGFVKQSGGFVVVNSEIGHGSQFRLFLPAIDELITKTETERTPSLDQDRPATLLVVEDESAVRKFATISLQRSGFDILEAESAGDALQILESNAVEIDLLITDVVMPQESGQQLAERVRRSHPNVKILFISGYTDDEVIRRGILHEKAHLLHKPFTSAALVDKVRRVLQK